MSQGEQDAVIGRMHRELKEAKTRLAALQHEAMTLAESFSQIGDALRRAPELVGLDGESSFPISIAPPGRMITVNRGIFNADRFRDLTHDIRQTMLKINELADNLR